MVYAAVVCYLIRLGARTEAFDEETVADAVGRAADAIAVLVSHMFRKMPSRKRKVLVRECCS